MRATASDRSPAPQAVCSLPVGVREGAWRNIKLPDRLRQKVPWAMPGAALVALPSEYRASLIQRAAFG